MNKKHSHKKTLLRLAQQYVAQHELRGGDWQQAVVDIVNDGRFAPLFAGLSEEQRDNLAKEISLGEQEE